MNAPCAVMNDLGRHLQSLDRDAEKKAEFDRLKHSYMSDGIDYGDVIGRTQEIGPMLEDFLALVSAGPDCLAKKALDAIVEVAAEDYAKCMMQRKAA